MIRRYVLEALAEIKKQCEIFDYYPDPVNHTKDINIRWKIWKIDVSRYHAYINIYSPYGGSVNIDNNVDRIALVYDIRIDDLRHTSDMQDMTCFEYYPYITKICHLTDIASLGIIGLIHSTYQQKVQRAAFREFLEGGVSKTSVLNKFRSSPIFDRWLLKHIKGYLAY